MTTKITGFHVNGRQYGCDIEIGDEHVGPEHQRLFFINQPDDPPNTVDIRCTCGEQFVGPCWPEGSAGG